MRDNRRAGNDYELKIIKELKEMGYDAVSTRSESKNLDNRGVDILSESFPYYIQCKNSKQNQNSYKIIKRENLPKDRPCLLFHKQTRLAGKNFVTLGEFVTMDKDIFYELIKTINDQRRIQESSSSPLQSD